MKSKNLEQISEKEAEQLVKEDIARFEHFGYCGDKLLVFNQTHNTYHKNRQTKKYERIGSMQTGRENTSDCQI